MSADARFSAHFAPTYRAARRLFLDATSAAGLTLQTYAHPLPGAEGEALAMDVARAGGFELPALLVISSACHGVEGHCGSGVQHALLSDAGFLAEAQAAGVALLFVHALNPHGFSHSRRVTHEGVDLNRNFVDFGFLVAQNLGYDAIAHLVLPESWPPTPENEAALQAFATQHGDRALQQAITGGQYRHPQGLFYGGTAPTWSHLTIQRVLRQHAAGGIGSVRRLAWIDLHTGLGPCGHGERIFAARPDEATLARARAWWSADGGTVTALHDGSSSASQISGMLWQAAYDSCPQAEFTGIALEYGTVPLPQALLALRFDHWCAANPQAPTALREAARQAMGEAFYIDTDAWKKQVVMQGLAAARLALAGLSA